MPEFTFLEYGPDQADDALIEQTARFIFVNPSSPEGGDMVKSLGESP